MYKSGLKELTISVDGLKDNHDFIRGNGNFDKVVKKINLVLKENLFDISIAFTVTSLNFYDIERFIEEFISMGIKKFYFFRYCNNSNSEILSLNSKNLLYTTEKLINITEKYKNINIIYEKSSFYPFNSLNNKIEGCNFMNNIMTIRYNGDVIVCPAIPKVLGNIFKDNLDIIYNRILCEKNTICQIPIECHNCNYKIYCHGGCKSISYNRYKNYLHKDELCFIKQ